MSTENKKDPSWLIDKIVTLEAIPALGNQLRSAFQYPQTLLLCGHLGAGKTTLVRHLLTQAGHPVMSPAFAIRHHYPPNIDHVDLYRLKNDEDLESTGFWEIFQLVPHKKNQKILTTKLIIIEWADRLQWSCLPPSWHYITVTMDFVKNHPYQRHVRAKHLYFH